MVRTGPFQVDRGWDLGLSWAGLGYGATACAAGIVNDDRVMYLTGAVGGQDERGYNGFAILSQSTIVVEKVREVYGKFRQACSPRDRSLLHSSIEHASSERPSR